MSDAEHVQKKMKSTLYKELAQPSKEQKAIIAALSEGYNIGVDAVPGSGKTFLALRIAKENSEKRILILTYNSHLKAETREKIKDYGLNNTEAHSFHAFLHNYYGKCTNDSEFRNITTSTKQPKNDIDFDIIYIDE